MAAALSATFEGGSVAKHMTDLPTSTGKHVGIVAKGLFRYQVQSALVTSCSHILQLASSLSISALPVCQAEELIQYGYTLQNEGH